jgi:hypothetical protein
MVTRQPSKSELLAAAQAVLQQDDRERAESAVKVTRPRSSGSLSPKRYFLLKTRLFPPKQITIPAKASMRLEGLVLIAAVILCAAILMVVLSHVRHG